jgi:hypothetical protein
MWCSLVLQSHLLLLLSFFDLILLLLFSKLLLEIVFFHFLDFTLCVVHVLNDLVSCTEAKVCDVDCASTSGGLEQ